MVALQGRPRHGRQHGRRYAASFTGSRSSLFLSQDAGQAVKKIWETLIYTGMFGPIKVDRT